MAKSAEKATEKFSVNISKKAKQKIRRLAFNRDERPAETTRRLIDIGLEQEAK
jgi:hypothetical protein